VRVAAVLDANLSVDVQWSFSAARRVDLRAHGDLVSDKIVLARGSSECRLGARLLGTAREIPGAFLQTGYSRVKSSIPANVLLENGELISLRINEVNKNLAVLASIADRRAGTNIGDVVVEDESVGGAVFRDERTDRALWAAGTSISNALDRYAWRSWDTLDLAKIANGGALFSTVNLIASRECIDCSLTVDLRCNSGSG